jgi:glyoxylase-like metal-dependent hydrolase (beta-lactamase superfamily II)
MPFFKPKPAQVDELLSDGQVLPVLGGLHVINTSGHTPGHISLYAPAAKILFCGDSMVVEGNGTLRCSRGANTWDEDKAKESVKVQQTLGAESVCSGHGPIVREAAGKFPL